MGEAQSQEGLGDSSGLQPDPRKSVGTEGREEISLHLGFFSQAFKSE